MRALTESANGKVVIVGGKNGLPLIINIENGEVLGK